MSMNRLLAGAATCAVLCGTTIAAGAQDVTLRLSNTFPENHFLWQNGGKVFVDAVDEATSGAVTVEAFHAGQLGKDQLGLLDSGLAQMAVIAAPYAPEKLPLTGVVELPGFISGACEGADRVWPLVREGGALDQHEYEPLGLRVLFIAVPPPYKVMTGSTAVTGLADLAGLKLRTVGAAQGDTVVAVGATPIQVQASEFYDSVSRGTVDGAIYAYVGMPPYSLGEVMHHAVDNVFAGSLAVLYAIDADTWAGLTPEIQTAMTEAAATAQRAVCEYQDADEAAIRERYVAEKGLTVVSFPESDTAAWNERMAGVAAAWAKRLDENGRPGTEILEAYRTSGASGD
ncbi:MAG TPA: TRAP transporter substrate-binding protein DctP [Geminicoccaceae bacterium]|nr:TRAP transporter substrate-binding protein DctP [Geminicoccaceae bacterium]